MDLQSRLKKLRTERKDKKTRSQFRYQRWGHDHAPGTESSVNRGAIPQRGPVIPENDHDVNDLSVNRGAVPQRGPVIPENDHVDNDLSVNRGAVPQRGPVIPQNDHVVNYLYPSTEVHGNQPITSDAPSSNDRDDFDFDIERDESMSEELTSNAEENDINEPELEHTYLESETLNEHEESANNSCSSVSYTHLTLPTIYSV